MAQLTISISELRNHSDEYLQRVKSGEVILITEYGKPFAQFMPVQKMRKEQNHLTQEPRRKGSGS